jgi:hypothetical protein
VKNTHDPLRIHAGDGPSGSAADVYQFLLELAAHTVRHTAQIHDVTPDGSTDTNSAPLREQFRKARQPPCLIPRGTGG